jgi:hypothetical protein
MSGLRAGSVGRTGARAGGGTGTAGTNRVTGSLRKGRRLPYNRPAFGVWYDPRAKDTLFLHPR